MHLEEPGIRNGKVFIQLYDFHGTPVKDGYLRVNRVAYGGVLIPHIVEIITQADGKPLKPAPLPHGEKAFISKQIAVVSVECQPWEKEKPRTYSYNIKLFFSDNGKLEIEEIEKGIPITDPPLTTPATKRFEPAVKVAFYLVKGQMEGLSRYEKWLA